MKCVCDIETGGLSWGREGRWNSVLHVLTRGCCLGGGLGLGQAVTSAGMALQGSTWVPEGQGSESTHLPSLPVRLTGQQWVCAVVTGKRAGIHSPGGSKSDQRESQPYTPRQCSSRRPGSFPEKRCLRHCVLSLTSDQPPPCATAPTRGNQRLGFNDLFSLLYRMAALFLKKLTLQTVKTENYCIRRCLGQYILQGPVPTQQPPRPSCLIHAKTFSTEDTQDEMTKKKKNATAFSSVGRKINERIIHVLDEQGNDLGHMHRANVIRLMAERGLRLVQRDASAEPPQYQLLTGAQIHQERLRLREAERAAPKPGRYPALCSHVPRAGRSAV